MAAIFNLKKKIEKIQNKIEKKIWKNMGFSEIKWGDGRGFLRLACNLSYYTCLLLNGSKVGLGTLNVTSCL